MLNNRGYEGVAYLNFFYINDIKTILNSLLVMACEGPRLCFSIEYVCKCALIYFVLIFLSATFLLNLYQKDQYFNTSF